MGVYWARGIHKAEFAQHRIDDSGKVLAHLGVPHAVNAVSGLAQPFAASFVPNSMETLPVVSSVDLNDKPSLEVHEVDDVWPERMLAAELQASNPPFAKLGPKNAFFLGRVPAQTPCSVVRHDPTSMRQGD